MGLPPPWVFPTSQREEDRIGCGVQTATDGRANERAHRAGARAKTSPQGGPRDRRGGNGHRSHHRCEASWFLVRHGYRRAVSGRAPFHDPLDSRRFSEGNSSWVVEVAAMPRWSPLEPCHPSPRCLVERRRKRARGPASRHTHSITELPRRLRAPTWAKRSDRNQQGGHCLQRLCSPFLDESGPRLVVKIAPNAHGAERRCRRLRMLGDALHYFSPSDGRELLSEMMSPDALPRDLGRHPGWLEG